MENLKVLWKQGNRTMYQVQNPNKKGEKLVFEVNKVYYNNKSKNSFPKLWKKYGYTNHLYDSCIWIDCEVTNEKGETYRKYEPTAKNGKIVFDWMFEVSEENEKKLIAETLRRFEETC